MKQKEIFLSTEGDAWFERNRSTLLERPSGLNDPVVRAVTRCLEITSAKEGRLLEVGCAEGARLKWLMQNYGIQCQGIEPSAKAVAVARADAVEVIKGTADELPYESQSFDILVFGFCLYLCDRGDLFRIAQEAHRVLKPSGWVIVHDFFATTPVKREYHHLPGVFSYKMDYRNLFDWHPDYTCFSHEVNAHGASDFTENPNEWVATSILRKRSGV